MTLRLTCAVLTNYSITPHEPVTMQHKTKGNSSYCKYKITLKMLIYLSNYILIPYSHVASCYKIFQ